MARPSFQIEDEAENWVEERLVHGVSKSAWYRYAIKTMIQCDPILDQLYERYEWEKRQEFVEAAVKEKVDRVQNDVQAGHERNINGDS